MRKVYEAYKDIVEIPKELGMISWSQNCILVDKIDEIEKRLWYARQFLENGWSKTVLSHQIDLELYERQAMLEKLTNFDNRLPASYKVKNAIPKEIMEKLPTEEELNLYIKKLSDDDTREEND